MIIGTRCAAVPTSPPEDPSVHTHALAFPCPTLCLFLTDSHRRYPCSLCSNGSSADDAFEQPATAQTAAMITTIDVPHGGAVCGDAGDVYAACIACAHVTLCGKISM